MKQIYFLFIAALLFGCSKDSDSLPDEPEEPSTPSGIIKSSTEERLIKFSKDVNEGDPVLTIKETIKSDAPSVNKTESYIFSNSKIIKHSIKQEYYPGFTTTYETELTYQDKSVVVADNNGNTLTYTLNDDGCATQCKYETGSQIRFYYFTYSADNYLTRIEESIGNTFFSSLDLSYENGDLTSVTTFINDIKNKILYTPGSVNNSDKLPCLPLSEAYPMSNHVEALYAGLLGEASPHYVAKTQPEGNIDEWTDYTYSINSSGNLQSIKMITHFKGVVYP